MTTNEAFLKIQNVYQKLEEGTMVGTLGTNIYLSQHELALSGPSCVGRCYINDSAIAAYIKYITSYDTT